MSERDVQSEHRECGGDAAAYALGALEPHEAETFRKHLADCVVCRDEVSAFQAVVDVVPLSAPPQRVPRSLKRRVMAEVRTGSTASKRAPRRRSAPRSWLPRPVLAGLSAVLVVLVALAAVQAFSTSSSTRVVHASVTWPGSAFIRLSGSRGELVVRGMPAPPSGKIYEVWVQRARSAPAPTSALFTVTASGAGNVDVPGNLNGVSRVMVTPEPMGGSTVPTHAPVLLANLS
jgi:anti-sigma-K factor RskA